jgi:hypothetical protein
VLFMGTLSSSCLFPVAGPLPFSGPQTAYAALETFT